MAHSEQELKQAERERKEILGYVNRLSPLYPSFDHEKTRQYKKALEECNRIANNPRRTPASVHEALMRLKSFY